MTLQSMFEELIPLKEIIEKELKKFPKVEYEKSDIEQEFLFSHLCGIESDLEYVVECIDYAVNRPIMKEGKLCKIDGEIYIDNLKLEEPDTIEIFLEGSWQKVDIFKVDGEYIANYLGSAIRQQLPARIRLSVEAAHKRLK